MRKLVLLILVLFLSIGTSFAESFDTDLFLFCHNTGQDEYKYDILVKQALIVNDLQLNKEQKQELEKIFNTYGTDYAQLKASLEENKIIYNKMKKDKTSFSIKQDQRKKMSDLKKEIKVIQRKMIKETKKHLTFKQRCKYNTLVKTVF